MPLKPCIECGTLTRQARCPDHQLGDYGWQHQQLRLDWKPAVDAGEVQCRRAPYGLCVADDPVIRPGEPWDLGHPDHECPAPTAPEHRLCNRGAPRRRR